MVQNVQNENALSCICVSHQRGAELPCSCPCLNKPCCRCSLLVLHLFTLLCQYYPLQRHCLIFLICSNHRNISSRVICCRRASDIPFEHVYLRGVTNGSTDCVNSSVSCVRFMKWRCRVLISTWWLFVIELRWSYIADRAWIHLFW